MNLDQFDGFLLGATFVCALGFVLNLFMIRRRGKSAAYLAGAFLALGLTVTLFRRGAPNWSLSVGVIGVLALLIGDFVLRAGASPRPTKRGRR